MPAVPARIWLMSLADWDCSVSSSACNAEMRVCRESLSAASLVLRRTRPFSSGARSEAEFISRRARYRDSCERLPAMLLSSTA